jgi:hypothetical protein
MDDLPRQTLREIVARYGTAITKDPRRCRALLMDLCGAYKPEIFVLTSALEEEVVNDLLMAQPGVPVELLLRRLVKRLMDNCALAEGAARWAVESWALALGVPVPPGWGAQAQPLVPTRTAPARTAAARTATAPAATPSPRPRRTTDDKLPNRVKQYVGLEPIPPLDLSHSDVTDAGLAHLRPLRRLTELNLGGCERITDLGLAHLTALRRLKTLNLSRCPQITDKGIIHLRTLIRLEELDLSRCPQITDEGIKHLGTLPRLTSLDLSGTDITDAGLIHLSHLNTLTNLKLYKCDITDKGLAHLRAFTQLTHLSLEGCELITNRGLRHLHYLPKLVALNLMGCRRLTHRGVAAINRPGLAIVWQPG